MSLNKLLNCRFCGGKPILEKLSPISFIVRDCGCFHVEQLNECIKKHEKHYSLSATHFFIKAWNARNEKNNPFLEGK